MIEIINIIYLIAGLTLIFLSPTFLVCKFGNKYGLNFFEIYSINIILILNIFLIFSFFTFNLNYIFFLFLIIGIINISYLYKKYNFNKNYLFLIFLLFVFIYSINIASNLRLEWDAAVNWIFKTKNFYEGFNFSNLKNVEGSLLGYPHLGTYGWALIWKNSFIDFEYTGRIFYIFIYLSSIFLLISKYYFNFLFNLIVSFVIIKLTFDLALFSGYQEPLMFPLVIFIFLLIYKLYNSNQLNFFHLICIFNANLILWIKNEGIIFIILFLIILFIKKEIKIKTKIFLFFSIITLVLIKFYVFNTHFNENLVGWIGYKFITFDQSFSLENLKKLPLLFYQTTVVFFKYPIYLIFILLIFYLFLTNKKKHIEASYILLFLFSCLVTTAIYYFTDDPRWYFHASVTIDRLLYQASGVYLIFIMYIFNIFFMSNKKIKSIIY
jgi:hypothetical protein